MRQRDPSRPPYRNVVATIFAAVVIGLPLVAYGSGDVGAMFSLNLTTPQIVSVSAGLGYKIDDTVTSDKWTNGFMAQIEPGIGGAKGHLVYFRGKGGSRGGFAWAVKASALRTYGHPVGAEGGQTYLGGELQAGLIPLIKINAGVYRHTSGDDTRDWLFSAGIGIGF